MHPYLKVSYKYNAHNCEYLIDDVQLKELILKLKLAQITLDLDRMNIANFFLKNVSSKTLKYEVKRLIDPNKADSLIALLEQIIGYV